MVNVLDVPCEIPFLFRWVEQRLHIANCIFKLLEVWVWVSGRVHACFCLRPVVKGSLDKQYK